MDCDICGKEIDNSKKSDISDGETTVIFCSFHAPIEIESLVEDAFPGAIGDIVGDPGDGDSEEGR